MKWLFRIFLSLSVFLLTGDHDTQAVAYRDVHACALSLHINHTANHFKARLLPTCANHFHFSRTLKEEDSELILAEEKEDESLQWTLLKKSKIYSSDIASVYAPYHPGHSFFFKDCLPFPAHLSYAAANRYLLIQVFRI